MNQEALRTFPAFDLRALNAITQSADLKWHATPLLASLRKIKLFQGQDEKPWAMEKAGIRRNPRAMEYIGKMTAEGKTYSRVTANIIVALERRMGKSLSMDEVGKLGQISLSIENLAIRSRLSRKDTTGKDHKPWADKDVNLHLFVEVCLSLMKIEDKNPDPKITAAVNEIKEAAVKYGTKQEIPVVLKKPEQALPTQTEASAMSRQIMIDGEQREVRIRSCVVTSAVYGQVFTGWLSTEDAKRHIEDITEGMIQTDVRPYPDPNSPGYSEFGLDQVATYLARNGVPVLNPISQKASSVDGGYRWQEYFRQFLQAGGAAFGGASHAYAYRAGKAEEILRFDPLYGTGHAVDIGQYEDGVAKTLYLIPPPPDKTTEEMYTLLEKQYPLITQVWDTNRLPKGVTMWHTDEVHLYYTKKSLEQKYRRVTMLP